MTKKKKKKVHIILYLRFKNRYFPVDVFNIILSCDSYRLLSVANYFIFCEFNLVHASVHDKKNVPTCYVITTLILVLKRIGTFFHEYGFVT